MNKITIYRASPLRVKLRGSAARLVQKAAINDFGGMPFAERWLEKAGISRSQARIGIRELQRLGGLIEYHVLKAATGDSMTSQHEHTMIIREEGAEVTTFLQK
jgi:methionine aminopeptidase